jgi:uncharacterized repeat protein (TIGR01451 family)
LLRNRSVRTVAILLFLFAQLAVTARADNPPAPQPTGASPQSLVDGCQRDPAALIAGSTPEWAYVYNTPSDQPPPPPQWVSGVANSFNPQFQAVHTSGADFAFGHDAYDFNLNLLPDPQYQFLISGHPASGSDPATGGYAGNGEETERLHTEDEDLTVPQFAWPEPGDRVTEEGSWIWDCGHWGTPTNIFSPDYDLPHEGQPCPSFFAPDPSQCTISGERTEFHPYRVLFDQRTQSSNSPSGENEAELFVSTDKTRAGKTIDCAHKFPPPASTVLPNPAAYPPQFAACMETEPNWQDVTGDYSFLVPAPAKPTPDAQLVFRAVDRGSVGAPAPTLTQEGDAVRVTFHLDSAPNQRIVMGYQIFVGWDTVPVSSVPAHLRVTFDRLDIHRAMDPGCSRQQPVPGCDQQSTRQNQATTAPGDWNLWWDVNGIWGHWPSVPPGVPPVEFLPSDGSQLPGSQTVDLYVPPGKGWRLYVHGRECDVNGVDPARPLADCPTNQELADDNDVPGMILDSYPSADASLGTHTTDAQTHSSDPTSTCPDTNVNGCYSLTYTVTRVNDDASRVRLPDLVVTQTDSPDPVTVGNELTYDVNVKNNGAATAGGVTLADQLPAGVIFDSATPSQGTCTPASGTVSCQLGTLGSGQSADVEIKVTPQQGGTITNVASVTSNEDDANTADNMSREDTTVFARYARPKGATPVRVSLVPSFRACTSPNTTHGNPLTFGSCRPPVQQSSSLTVGTFDANGNAANSVGSVRFDVIPGDVQETISISDVRNSVDLSDYTGSLQENATVRITDRNNSPGDDQGTVQDLPFGATVPCAATTDPNIGGTCALSTTFDALSPGAVTAGDRAIWELGKVQLLDASSSPFAVQGVFVP